MTNKTDRQRAEELLNAIIDSFNNGQGTAPSLIAIENALRQVADDARKEEREACARLLEECRVRNVMLKNSGGAYWAEEYRDEIRNRSTQE